MSRKTSREVAMMLTYEKIFGCDDDTYKDVLEKQGIDGEPAAADVKFALDIVNGVQEHLEEIDKLIEVGAKSWPISRMPKVDLSILRNAVFEIIYDANMDDAISVNEAIELAKVYCDEQSPKFINGVLGGIVRNKTISV